MSLTGLGLLVVLLLVAVGVCWATGLLWQRFSGSVAFAVRAGMLMLVMVSGAVLCADVVNRHYVFYTSIGELIGGHSVAPTARPLADSLDAATTDLGRRRARVGHGTMVKVELDGARSHIRRPGFVYLPAAYFTGPGQQLRFPVLELFHGTPGGPGNWPGQMHLAATLDAEIGAARMPPVIAVVPQYARRGGKECLNTPQGAEETYLAVDLPVLLARTLRVQTGIASWAAAGYSTGGNCAVDLAVRHPETFAAAASLAGDRASRARHETQAGAELVSAPRVVPGYWPALYLMSSKQDGQSVAGMRALQQAAAGHAQLTTVELAGGGHNWGVWYAASIPAFDWLGARLPPPSAPPRIDPFTVTIQPRPGFPSQLRPHAMQPLRGTALSQS